MRNKQFLFTMNITGGQDPLVLAASILATAINGAQQQHQNAIQVIFMLDAYHVYIICFMLSSNNLLNLIYFTATSYGSSVPSHVS